MFSEHFHKTRKGRWLGVSSADFHTSRFVYINRSKYAALVLSVDVRWVGGWGGTCLPDFHTQQIKTYSLSKRTINYTTNTNTHTNTHAKNKKRQRRRHYSVECGKGGWMAGVGTSAHPEIKCCFENVTCQCGTKVGG